MRSTVVKGAPEITPGNRVRRDVMRVGLIDKPGTCSKHEDKRMGRQKKKRKDPVFEGLRAEDGCQPVLAVDGSVHIFWVRSVRLCNRIKRNS